MRNFISSFVVLTSLPIVAALSIQERAKVSRSRLTEALRSPSGKLTLSPEVVIPEPSDPTAILLLSSGIASTSEMIRVQAKANAAWVEGSVTSLKMFCSEQEQSRGNFPGPIPVVYCGDSDDLAGVINAGADALMISACGGEEVTSLDDLVLDATWVEKSKAALECGLLPIPEVFISDATAQSWGEEEMEGMVSKIAELYGEDPVSILVTINPEDEENPTAQVSLPKMTKALGKRTPIIGSIRAQAGENRIGQEVARLKEAGFTGALLRSDCMPGLRMKLDLDFVGAFWSACIGDLKSLKSKSFNFQSRNWMDKSASLEWAKYQNSILESGALGDPETSVGLNTEGGDFKGF
ncbi:unnamed protein product [Cylindrotheca closterium]|uniref:Uncharacterized protein n=1 Tax=Cylindrotheca closterium TaxID=2856 RepID=A0AAD2JND1_9STRA|nr:unnamed protein product [Cylindrotheca closterium]